MPKPLRWRLLRRVPAVLLLLTVRPAPAAGDGTLDGLILGEYAGWTNCLALHDSRQVFQAVVVPGAGGRVVQYSHRLRNILYLHAPSEGRTLAGAGGEFFVGGYHCDLGPEIHGVPPRPELLLGAHDWRTPRHYTVETASPAGTRLGLRVLKSFTLDPDTGELGILQRLLNHSEREVNHCLWDRTACKPGGYVFFPVNPASRFPKQWSLQRSLQGRLYYDEETPEGPEVRVEDGLLVVKTGDGPYKIGADSPAGWIAYARDKLLFLKYFPHYPGGNYSSAGNTVEVAWNESFTELSALSPTVRLRPGQQLDFPERWVLLPLKSAVNSPRDVRKLARDIAPTPFVVQ